MDTYMAKDLPFPESPVVPEMVDGGKTIQFQCRKGIACWNACCSNIDISLTPYDILRLKRRLGLASAAFLQQYACPTRWRRTASPASRCGRSRAAPPASS